MYFVAIGIIFFIMNVLNKRFLQTICHCKDFVKCKEGERLLKRSKWFTILGRRIFVYGSNIRRALNA
jgi:hypothetical protein